MWLQQKINDFAGIKVNDIPFGTVVNVNVRFIVCQLIR